MRWYKDLYLSENLEKDRKTIEKRVEKKIHVRPLYLVVLSEYTHGQLEIIPVTSIHLPLMHQREYDVLGVAKGYYHARSLVGRIIGDVYKETENCDCKAFFSDAFPTNQKE